MGMATLTGQVVKRACSGDSLRRRHHHEVSRENANLEMVMTEDHHPAEGSASVAESTARASSSVFGTAGLTSS